MTVDVNNSFLTNKTIDYAMLSELAYANWSNGVPDEYNTDWDTLYKKGYRFIDQYTDTATGYSGTIFYNTNTQEYSLANRGTELSVWPPPIEYDPNDFAADLELAANVTPGEQFKSMINFINSSVLQSSNLM